MNRDEFELELTVGRRFRFQGQTYEVESCEAFGALENGVLVKRNHSVTCTNKARVKVIDTSIVELMELLPEEEKT